MDLKSYNEQKKQLGYTFKDLSQKTGLSVRNLIRVFNGEANPTASTIQAIEKALGLSPITDEEYQAGVREYAVRNITADEDDLLEDYRELGIKKGAEAQAAIRSVLKNMLK